MNAGRSKPRLPFDIEFLLEGVLAESPDHVYSEDGRKINSFYDGSSYAFYIIDDFSILGIDTTHFEMTDALRDVYHSERRMQRLDVYSDTLLFSDKNKLIKSLESGTLADYFDEFPECRTRLGLSGRLWANNNIISFWNTRRAVMSKWSDVEDMFNRFSSALGDLEDYRIDWIERSTDKGQHTALAPAKTLSSSGTTFFNALGINDADSTEEIKAAQQKLHVLPPEEKKKILNVMGKQNIKAKEVADKLEMSVAEFNHTMHQGMDEVKHIKLSEIVKRIRKK